MIQITYNTTHTINIEQYYYITYLYPDNLSKKKEYRRQDLNLHAYRHLVLSQACLPISSLRLKTYILRGLELNQLPLDYEPNEIPFLHPA